MKYIDSRRDDIKGLFSKIDSDKQEIARLSEEFEINELEGLSKDDIDKARRKQD